MDLANPTASVRPGEELDAAALARFLLARVPGLTGPLRVRQFPGGASNLTYLLSFADRDLVLRRPPAGTKAKGAHDMAREFRVIAALAGTGVPAPRPLLFAEDASVIGAEFYVMEKVDGGILARELPSGWLDRTADRARLCERFVDGLVAIHAVDCRAAGLADLGRPGGYVERQIRGWNRRYVDALTPDVPDCAGIRAWLEARMPTEAGATLVHGDYRLDNIVLEAERGASPRIAAVLDWEMATIGDPLMDLGNALAYWVEARDPEELHALRMQPSHAEGMWTRAQILEHYSRRTGLSTARFDFYRVYGLFRLAVIVQQIYYRWFHKQTANPRFATFGRWVEVLARRCREAIDRAA